MLVIEIMLCQWGLSNGYVLPMTGRWTGPKFDRPPTFSTVRPVFGHSEPADSGALLGLQMCP